MVLDELDAVLRAGLEKLPAGAEGVGSKLPDLLICTMPTAACPDFAEARGLPFVMNLPIFNLMSPIMTQLPYVPAAFLGLRYGKMAPWQRLLNLLPTAAIRLIIPFTGWPTEAFRPMAEGTAGRLVLVPGVPGLDYPQHTPPLVQYTGPYLKANDTHPALLTEEVRGWLEAPGAPPALYISMGTVVQLTDALCATFLAAVREAAAAGEFRALWALPANQHSCLGADGAGDLRGPGGPLLVSTWVHTPAALAHPNVRAFLSHCGANGVAESVWVQTPMLGLPFFGDQPDNCHRVRDQNLGVELDRMVLTPKDIRDGFRRVVTEPQFAASLRRVGHVLRAYGGVARAAELVEMVHRLGGDLSFLQTSVDTQGVMAAYCLDLLLAAVCLLSCCCFACGRRSARGAARPRPEGSTKDRTKAE